jgi:hypothetical protein
MLLEGDEYERAATELEDAMTPFGLQAEIRAEYGDHKLGGWASDNVPLQLAHIATGPVITTNFDRALEAAFELYGTPFKATIVGVKTDIAMESVSAGERVVIKLHGDWQSSHDRVLTHNDYKRLYGDSTQADTEMRRMLRDIAAGRCLLFVGCSLRQDRTMEVLKDAAVTGAASRHFAIVECPADPNQKWARERFLYERNIVPIWYEHRCHDQVLQILSYLSEVKSAAQRGASRKSGGSRRMPPLLRTGPIAHTMCDRRSQSDKYCTFFADSLKACDGMVRITVVHGRADQCHKGLCDRLIAEGSTLAIAASETGTAPVSREYVPWRYGNRDSVKALADAMWREIYSKHTRKAPMTIPTAIEFRREIVRQRKHVVFTIHTIQSDRWRYGGEELLRYHLDAWEQLNPIKWSTAFHVLINVVHPMTGIRSVARSYNLRITNSLVRQIRDRIPASRFLVLDELMAVRRTDVDDWFQEHADDVSDMDRTNIIDSIYRGQFGIKRLTCPMIRIEREYNSPKNLDRCLSYIAVS